MKGEMEELSEQVEKFREDMAGFRSRAEGIEAEIQELKKQGSDDTSSLGNVKRQMTVKVGGSGGEGSECGRRVGIWGIVGLELWCM